MGEGDRAATDFTQGGLYNFANINGELVLAGFGESSGGSHSCDVEYTSTVTLTNQNLFIPTTTRITLGSTHNVLCASDGLFYYSSSARKLKNTILPISDIMSIDSILKLKAKCFRYNANDSKLQVGFIAEEVAKINPSFALWGKDFVYDKKGQKIKTSDSNLSCNGFQLKSNKLVPSSINQRAILGALIEKIKELESIIKVLEG
tara:strand:+ start:8011 stop:8622 length:612 start_codon:yes stop_codon:yes gene_type:complete